MNLMFRPEKTALYLMLAPLFKRTENLELNMPKQNITPTMCEENLIFRYLCPSLLSENDILEELKAKCCKIKGLERKNRNELTEIFIRHLMPFPQRIFPDNHHGKLVNRMIQKENHMSKRNEKTDEKRSSLQFGFADKKKESSSMLGKGSSSTAKTDRLKPPIGSAEVPSRKISLSKTSSSSTSLDNVKINDHFKEVKESSTEQSGGRRNSTEFNESKKVELKRTHSSSSEKSDEGSPKKSRQRIAWP